MSTSIQANRQGLPAHGQAPNTQRGMRLQNDTKVCSAVKSVKSAKCVLRQKCQNQQPLPAHSCSSRLANTCLVCIRPCGGRRHQFLLLLLSLLLLV